MSLVEYVRPSSRIRSILAEDPSTATAVTRRAYVRPAIAAGLRPDPTSGNPQQPQLRINWVTTVGGGPR